MDEWRMIAERKIREAMDEGAFDHLAGKGRPLDLAEDPFEPPALRMAHRLLRNNGFAPAWIEERRDLEREIAAAQNEIPRSRERIAALNRRILSCNLKTPRAVAPLLPIRAEEPGR